MNRRFLLYAIACLVGVGSMLLPIPFEETGLILFLVAFLVLILLGHKIAYRNNKYGILEQYTHPIKLFREHVNKNEKIIMNATLYLIGGILLGFLFRSSSYF